MIDIFEDGDPEWVEAELQKHLTIENLRKLINVVAFYSHPDTYFAVGFLVDPPAGEFADDFSECTVFEGDDEVEVPAGYRPGKLARDTMKAIFGESASVE